MATVNTDVIRSCLPQVSKLDTAKSIPSNVFYKKCAPINFTKFTRKHLIMKPFLRKL